MLDGLEQARHQEAIYTDQPPPPMVHLGPPPLYPQAAHHPSMLMGSACMMPPFHSYAGSPYLVGYPPSIHPGAPLPWMSPQQHPQSYPSSPRDYYNTAPLMTAQHGHHHNMVTPDPHHVQSTFPSRHSAGAWSYRQPPNSYSPQDGYAFATPTNRQPGPPQDPPSCRSGAYVTAPQQQYQHYHPAMNPSPPRHYRAMELDEDDSKPQQVV